MKNTPNRQTDRLKGCSAEGAAGCKVMATAASSWHLPWSIQVITKSAICWTVNLIRAFWNWIGCLFVCFYKWWDWKRKIRGKLFSIGEVRLLSQFYGKHNSAQRWDFSGVWGKHHGKIVVFVSNATIFPNTTLFRGISPSIFWNLGALIWAESGVISERLPSTFTVKYWPWKIVTANRIWL